MNLSYFCTSSPLIDINLLVFVSTQFEFFIPTRKRREYDTTFRREGNIFRVTCTSSYSIGRVFYSPMGWVVNPGSGLLDDLY